MTKLLKKTEVREKKNGISFLGSRKMALRSKCTEK